MEILSKEIKHQDSKKSFIAGDPKQDTWILWSLLKILAI